MVYCGRPSKGCSSCRERKVRCDGSKPNCGQCVKRQQQCPGYRNLVDLMFRDESSHVIKKAKARARRKGVNFADSSDSSLEAECLNTSVTPQPLPLGSPSNSTRHLSPTMPNNYSRTQSPSATSSNAGCFSEWEPPDGDSTPMIALLYELNPSFQERGTAYFFSRYVTLEQNTCHQRFDFIHEVWRPGGKQSQEADVVLACITAVGLLGLANMTHSGVMMDAARKSYGTALLLTNRALKSPAEALGDTTMLSVLILGLCEMQKTRSGTSAAASMRVFQDHVNGATALAKERGVSQFDTHAGVRMFRILCQRAFISCAQRDLALPGELVNLQEALVALKMEKNRGQAVPNPSMRLFGPVYGLLQTRCDMRNGILTDQETVIARLLAIEYQLAQIMTDVPPSWRYRIFTRSSAQVQMPDVFNGILHIYSSPWHAAQWNCVRTLRVLVLETVLREIGRDADGPSPRHSPYRWASEFAGARRLLTRLLEAIAASVPQSLGLVGPCGAANLEDDNCSMSKAENLTPASTPIPSVEGLGTPSPSISPPAMLEKTRTTAVSAGSSEGDAMSSLSSRDDDVAPTLLDPTRVRSPEDRARRFMLLASSLHPIVWPLYLVGTSSAASSDALRAYAAERLRVVATENSDEQAGEVAALVEEQRYRDSSMAPSWASWTPSFSTGDVIPMPMGGGNTIAWDTIPV